MKIVTEKMEGSLRSGVALWKREKKPGEKETRKRVYKKGGRSLNKKEKKKKSCGENITLSIAAGL